MVALVKLHEHLLNMAHDTLIHIFAKEVSPHVFQLLPKLIVLSLHSACVKIYQGVQVDLPII